MKIDPYKHKENFESWYNEVKDKGIKGITTSNSKILIQYLLDMKSGKNTTQRKPVSYIRLVTLKNRMLFIIKNFEERYNIKDITQTPEDIAIKFFNDMNTGIIKKSDGKTYKSSIDYVRVFKAFWHWYMRVEGREGKRIFDITTYISVDKNDNPEFVYFNEKEFKKLVDNAKYDYKVMFWFMYDTGIRFPTECINIRVSDITSDDKYTFVEIREETAKTFGRKIKLHYCSDMLKEYIQRKKLNDDDLIFNVIPRVFNQYTKRLGQKLFDSKKTLGKKTFNHLTGYDFRHSSACKYLPSLSPQVMMYRFGWKNMDMIHYYTKLLGMKDTSNKEDLLIDTTKSDLQKEIDTLKRSLSIMEEEVKQSREFKENWNKIFNNPKLKKALEDALVK